MSKDKARIGHVNSDHLWYGFDDGKSAALKDHKESGTNDSTIVAVVRLSDYAAIEARLKERDEFIEVRGKHLIEIADERDALKAKIAEKEVELLGLKEGLEHLKYSVEQCSLAANVYRSKLAECVAAIQYVMANNDKIKGWDKLHDAFYGAKK